MTSWPAEFDFLSDLSRVLRIGEDYRGRPSVGGLNVAFASSSARLSIDPSSHLAPVAPQLWAYERDNQVRRKSLHQVAPVYEAQEKKRPREGAVILYVGGGGGNRTRVRKRYTVGTTCLATSLCSRPGATDGQATPGPVT